jgi:large subunit ribosomal protein L29
MKSRVKELRNKNSVELQQELLELLRAQFGLRMQHATQQLSNTSQLNNIRRDIARTRTILSQKARQS